MIACKPVPVALEPDDDGLQRALLKFIGEFANWDLSSNTIYLEAARELGRAAHGEEVPLVVDPFAGGGSIPLCKAPSWVNLRSSRLNWPETKAAPVNRPPLFRQKTINGKTEKC